jgi:hypothetical protein
VPVARRHGGRLIVLSLGVNPLGGLSRLLAGAPSSVFNAVLAAVGALPLTPRGRRAWAMVPAAGALMVWLAVVFS